MKNLAVFCVCLGLVTAGTTSRAIDLKQSKITEVVNDVQIISAAEEKQKAAAVNDVFSMPDVLRTGAASRAELVAQDQTVTRIGANTIFSFDPADRTIDLKQGSLLFHAPHGKGGGAIHTGSATASVLGTTLIVTTTPNGGFKVLALEGKVEVKFLNGLKQKLDPGQMTFVLPGANQLAPVIIFRLDELIQNSLLVRGFIQPLQSIPLIQQQVEQQLLLLHSGKLTDTGLNVGDNASPDQVEVLDVNTVAQTSPRNPKDAYINQPSLTDPGVPTPPNHISTTPFLLPDNSYFAGQQFIGFQARNIFMNVFPDQVPGLLTVDLSPYMSLGAFEIVAANDFSIGGPVAFSGPFVPDTLKLIAGHQFLLAPGISITADIDNFLMSSPATLTLDHVVLDNSVNNTFLQIGGDVNVQNNSQLNAAGGLSINAGNNIAISGSRLNCDSALLTTFRGSISLDSSVLDATSQATLATPTSLSINNSTITSSGTVLLSSTHGSVNATATSITAHYLKVNSGDGILLDAAGHTVTGSGAGATASFTAPNLITMNNADFSTFAELNVRANTIVLVNDVLSLINNFGCQSGQANFSGPVVAGDVNFYNCSRAGNAVTSDSVTYSSGVINTPGINVYRN